MYRFPAHIAPSLSTPITAPELGCKPPYAAATGANVEVKPFPLALRTPSSSSPLGPSGGDIGVISTSHGYVQRLSNLNRWLQVPEIRNWLVGHRLFNLRDYNVEEIDALVDETWDVLEANPSVAVVSMRKAFCAPMAKHFRRMDSQEASPTVSTVTSACCCC